MSRYTLNPISKLLSAFIVGLSLILLSACAGTGGTVDSCAGYNPTAPEPTYSQYFTSPLPPAPKTISVNNLAGIKGFKMVVQSDYQGGKVVFTVLHLDNEGTVDVSHVLGRVDYVAVIGEDAVKAEIEALAWKVRTENLYGGLWAAYGDPSTPQNVVQYFGLDPRVLTC